MPYVVKGTASDIFTFTAESVRALSANIVMLSVDGSNNFKMSIKPGANNLIAHKSKFFVLQDLTADGLVLLDMLPLRSEFCPILAGVLADYFAKNLHAGVFAVDVPVSHTELVSGYEHSINARMYDPSEFFSSDTLDDQNANDKKSPRKYCVIS